MLMVKLVCSSGSLGRYLRRTYLPIYWDNASARPCTYEIIMSTGLAIHLREQYFDLTGTLTETTLR